jgi:FkbM family methyltransferase
MKAVAEVRRITPARCRKPLIGPLVTALRRIAWRTFGLQQAFDEQREHEETTERQLKALFQLHSSFSVRPGTLDWAILKSVVLENEYRLPEQLHPENIIVDIGMHIGTFCYAALLRGAQHVHGFEAEQENFRLAASNLKPFGDRVSTHHGAVWRSDRKGDSLFHQGSRDASLGSNTGGGSIFWSTTGEKLDVLAFDDIIHAVTDNGRKRVHLLKIDCEGSEFPILLTARSLHLIDNIRGEFHEMGDGTCNPVPIPAIAQVEGVSPFTVGALVQCLERAGFTVEWERSGASFHGWFFATRTDANGR